MKKDDEFYTSYEDIVEEVQHYDLTNKHVFCNCDEYQVSNFYKYFKDNFHTHGLSQLTCQGLNGVRVEYDGYTETITEGVFPCNWQSTLQKDTVYITNPPFSQLREMISTYVSKDIPFLIMGNINTMARFVLSNKVRLGYSTDRAMKFLRPDGSYKEIANVIWITNLDIHPIRKDIVYAKDNIPSNYIIGKRVRSVDKYDIVIRKSNVSTITHRQYYKTYWVKLYDTPIPEYNKIKNIPRTRCVMAVPITVYKYKCNVIDIIEPIYENYEEGYKRYIISI